MALSADIIDRHRMGAGGNSGSMVERVTLRDGRELILKHIAPDWDWMARTTHDRGRLSLMWEGALFERMPTVIDHTIVAVEMDGVAWNVFMRDVSSDLLSHDRRVTRDEVQRILSAIHEMHEIYRGGRFPQLCSLVDRYALLSPRNVRREREMDNPHGHILSRGWEAFPEFVSGTVVEAIFAVAEKPELLAEQLAKCEQTLIHGDIRLGNIGFAGDRVILIDWSERVGIAPPAVELAWFIGFDAIRMDASPDNVISDFRSLHGDRFDERALQLALIGGLLQVAPVLGISIIEGQDESRRRSLITQLSWWDEAVREALKTWSPN
jgi:phosphotransferase family enzyme